MSNIAQVIAQMAAFGMPPLPPNHPILDGKFKRFGPKKKYWYILREIQLLSGKNVVTGAFGFNQGDQHNTVPVTIELADMSADERAELLRKQKEYELKEAESKQLAADLAANRARDQWDKAADQPIIHPYLDLKKISPEGVRVSTEGQLLIPMMRGGRLVGLQKIDREGKKLYNKGMDKIGAGFVLGQLNGASLIGIGEGYATCRSVRMAMDETDDFPIVAAFDAGSILAVATVLRHKCPDAHLLFLADDDYQLEQRFIERLREDFKVHDVVPVDGATHTVIAEDGEAVQIMATWRTDAQGVAFIETDVRKGRLLRTFKYENAGVSRCKAAAKAVGNASVVIPAFAERGGRKWTDFNDLHVEESLDAVRAQIVFSIHAAQQPVIGSPAPSSATANVLYLPDGKRKNPVVSPAPPDAQQPKQNGEIAPMPDEKLNYFDDAQGNAFEAGELFPRGEGEEGTLRKEKPKKVYGQEHWDQVNYVLQNFILIYGEDMVWDCSQRMLMKISAMRTIVQNSDVMKFWGGEARKWVLKKNIVFDPQETPSPAESGSTATVNLFSGWKMKPKAGECLKIKTLLLHLCDANEDLMLWVERWLAYPLRHRGAKMETSIIMHGDEGSGKNFFFEKIIKKIYGEYGSVIGNAQLESQFNDWASMKLFMVADEVVTRSELKQMKGKLKYLVSGDSIIINPKGLPEHSEANHMNFVFLSNELQPLALDKTDRRYLVIWTPPALPASFYVEVAAEIEAGGIEAFYDYLLHEVDLGDFNEHSKPLYTDAKDDLIEKSLTPPERFYRDWSRGFLPLPFITCGATQLYDAYKVWCEKSGEPKYISQTLFSPTVTRYAGDAIEKKVIKYEYGHVVKQRHVFLVGEKPPDKTLADWVAGASALFDTDLEAYRSRKGTHVDT